MEWNRIKDNQQLNWNEMELKIINEWNRINDNKQFKWNEIELKINKWNHEMESNEIE